VGWPKDFAARRPEERPFRWRYFCSSLTAVPFFATFAARRVLLVAGAASLLSAHEPGLSTTECEIDDSAIRLTIGISPQDLPSLAPGADATSLLRMAPSLWSLRGEHGPLPVRATSVTRDAENGPVLHLAFGRPAGTRLTLRWTAFNRLPAGHRDYFSWMDSTGTVAAAQLLDAQHPEITLDLPSSAAAAPKKSHWWSATSGRAEQTEPSRIRRRLLVAVLAVLAGLVWLQRRALFNREGSPRPPRT